MRTFRNVLCVRFGKLIVRLWRSQRSRTVVWGGSWWDGSWKRPVGAGATPTAAAGAGDADSSRRYENRTQLEQRPPRAIFCLKLDNSCCYACYSCGNNCNVVVKLVQEYHCFFILFTSVLRKQFAANMFLREANSYKRALALRNSRLQCVWLNEPASYSWRDFSSDSTCRCQPTSLTVTNRRTRLSDELLQDLVMVKTNPDL